MISRRELVGTTAALIGARVLGAGREARRTMSEADPEPRQVLEVCIDDLGRDLLADAIAQGKAPNLAAAMASGMQFSTFYSGTFCSIARARALTGCESLRPQSYVGENVAAGLHSGGQPFNGPAGPWITYQMPGTKTHRGKFHLTGTGGWPGPIVGVDRFDEYSGSMANLTGLTSATNYYNWEKGTANASGSNVSTCTTFATNDTAADVLMDIGAGVDYIRAHFNAVHAPLWPLPPVDEPPGHTPTGVDARMDFLYQLDYWLGQIFTAAVEAGYVVIVWCDNGSPGTGKGSVKDAGLNTPCFVFGDGVSVGTSARLIQATDLFATIRRIRGAPVCSTPDSFDFTDEFLFGWNQVVPDRVVITHSSYDTGLGVAPAPGSTVRVARERRYKLVDDQGAVTFWDLGTNPGETIPVHAVTPTQLAKKAMLEAALP